MNDTALVCRPLLLALALALVGSSASSGCYRAEIQLSELIDAAAGQGGMASEPGCDVAPVEAEYENCRILLPTPAECSEQDANGWSGCYSGGCAVCSESVREYPYYFDWHPCCLHNTTCNANSPKKCNARCPPPTKHDKVRPCWLVEVNR